MERVRLGPRMPVARDSVTHCTRTVRGAARTFAVLGGGESCAEILHLRGEDRIRVLVRVLGERRHAHDQPDHGPGH